MMARAHETPCWVRCSFKQATLVICASNLVMVVYISQWLLGQHYEPSIESHVVYIRQANGTFLSRRMGTQEQLEMFREAKQARLAAKPVKLIERVKAIQEESVSQVLATSNSESLRQQTEISKRITGLKFEGLDKWRREKLKNALFREAASVKTEVTSQSEAPWHDGNGTVPDNKRLSKSFIVYDIRACGPWPYRGYNVPLEEEVAFDEVVNVLDQDEGSGLLPQGAEIEDGIIPGRLVPEVCRAEAHTDYDGVAVRWGLTHLVESAADCCEACLDQARTAKNDEKKCNIWVYCPAEGGCFSPDIYEHKHQECWLKQADEPKFNFKGHYDEQYRREHPNAPLIVPWVSGIVQS